MNWLLQELDNLHIYLPKSHIFGDRKLFIIVDFRMVVYGNNKWEIIIMNILLLFMNAKMCTFNIYIIYCVFNIYSNK